MLMDIPAFLKGGGASNSQCHCGQYCGDADIQQCLHEYREKCISHSHAVAFSQHNATNMVSYITRYIFGCLG